LNIPEVQSNFFCHIFFWTSFFVIFKRMSQITESYEGVRSAYPGSILCNSINTVFVS